MNKTFDWEVLHDVIVSVDWTLRKVGIVGLATMFSRLMICHDDHRLREVNVSLIVGDAMSLGAVNVRPGGDGLP